MPKSKSVGGMMTEIGDKLDRLNEIQAGRVAFAGIIRNITTRIDAAGDKIGRVVIEFRPEGETVAELDRLHKPDAEAWVVIMERAE